MPSKSQLISNKKLIICIKDWDLISWCLLVTIEVRLQFNTHFSLFSCPKSSSLDNFWTLNHRRKNAWIMSQWAWITRAIFKTGSPHPPEDSRWKTEDRHVGDISLSQKTCHLKHKSNYCLRFLIQPPIPNLNCNSPTPGYYLISYTVLLFSYAGNITVTQKVHLTPLGKNAPHLFFSDINNADM